MLSVKEGTRWRYVREAIVITAAATAKTAAWTPQNIGDDNAAPPRPCMMFSERWAAIVASNDSPARLNTKPMNTPKKTTKSSTSHIGMV